MATLHDHLRISQVMSDLYCQPSLALKNFEDQNRAILQAINKLIPTSDIYQISPIIKNFDRNFCEINRVSQALLKPPAAHLIEDYYAWFEAFAKVIQNPTVQSSITELSQNTSLLQDNYDLLSTVAIHKYAKPKGNTRSRMLLKASKISVQKISQSDTVQKLCSAMEEAMKTAGSNMTIDKICFVISSCLNMQSLFSEKTREDLFFFMLLLFFFSLFKKTH